MTVADEALKTSVRSTLEKDKRFSGLPVDVRVCNGEVFLKGKVETLQQADAVQFIVSGIPGVRHVNMEELEVTEGCA